MEIKLNKIEFEKHIIADNKYLIHMLKKYPTNYEWYNNRIQSFENHVLLSILSKKIEYKFNSILLNIHYQKYNIV